MVSEKRKTVLITGGSGMVGRYLTSLLLEKDYEVRHLSRKSNHFGKVRVFRWDPDLGILDPVVFEGVDYIIHLAGANIGEKRWNAERKIVIEKSRVASIQLIYRIVSENRFPVRAFISASATGYYGSSTSDRVLTENDLPSDDYLGSVCRKWEEAADMFLSLGTRVTKIRTGIVLDKNEGALSKFLLPAKFGIFPLPGGGKQWMPWIHPEDLAEIYLKSISDDNISGAYNAAAPQHIQQKDLMTTLARVMKKTWIPIPVPAFILKAVLGEMSDIVLTGSRVSSEKISEAGYKFRYDSLEKALGDILR